MNSKFSIDRRKFLQMSCGAAAALSVFGGPMGTALSFAAGNWQTVRQTRLLMGTIVSITTVTREPGAAEEALSAAFAEMERLVAIFDRHNSNSALGTLNAQGSLRGAPEELLLVMEQSRRLWQDTEAAFNPAIAPALELMEAARRKNSGVSGPILQEALSLADFASVRTADGNINLQRQGMSLTLDGIAKGYIADAASLILSRHGQTNHLIDAGGDLRASGLARPDQQGGRAARWTVGIQHPFSPGKILESAAIDGHGLATSGNYENYFNKSRSQHHIVNPHTGQSPDIASVTVRAPSAAQADALATALALMPPVKALEYVRGKSGTACLVIDRHGSRYS